MERGHGGQKDTWALCKLGQRLGYSGHIWRLFATKRLERNCVVGYLLAEDLEKKQRNTQHTYLDLSSLHRRCICRCIAEYGDKLDFRGPGASIIIIHIFRQMCGTSQPCN